MDTAQDNQETSIQNITDTNQNQNSNCTCCHEEMEELRAQLEEEKQKRINVEQDYIAMRTHLINLIRAADEFGEAFERITGNNNKRDREENDQDDEREAKRQRVL